MTLAPEIPAPADSALRRFDPRWKIVATILSCAALLCLRQLLPLFIAYLSSLLLVRLARVPLRWYLRRIGLLVPLLISLFVLLPFVLERGGPSLQFAGPLRISLDGLVAACRVSLLALSVLTVVLVLLGTTFVPELPRALHAVGVPGVLVRLLALTYRYLMLLFEEFGKLRTALRARGFRGGADLHTYRMVGNVTGTLVIRALERAERVGQAMRCRGYDGRFRSAAEYRTRPADVLLFVALLFPPCALVVWDRLLT